MNLSDVAACTSASLVGATSRTLVVWSGTELSGASLMIPCSAESESATPCRSSRVLRGRSPSCSEKGACLVSLDMGRLDAGWRSRGGRAARSIGMTTDGRCIGLSESAFSRVGNETRSSLVSFSLIAPSATAESGSCMMVFSPESRRAARCFRQNPTKHTTSITNTAEPITPPIMGPTGTSF